MSVATHESDVVQAMKAALAPKPLPRIEHTGPAIDAKPLVGGEITIHLALSPGMITLIAAPITIAVTMLVGWVTLVSAGMPVYGREMVAGAIVNTFGGMLASLPLFILMKKGAQAIAQAGLFGIAVRCGAILMGLCLAMGPGWALAKMPLVYWVLAYYFPLLIVETAVIAWLANKARH